MNTKKLKREHLQELARLRLAEARLLLDNARNSGAYYLTGLAVECALKACIAKTTEKHEFPELERVKDSWNHDLAKLVRTAGLWEELMKKQSGDKQFEANWLTVKDWRVDSRYEKRSGQEASDIYTATTEQDHGIMAWIERYW